jgi:UDP-glucose 4-epimerase
LSVALAEKGIEVIAGVRSARAVEGAQSSVLMSPDSELQGLREALEGAEAVVHLAAAVHDMRGRTPDAEYLRVNRDYPLLVAQAAVAANVRRFVFVSTIKVNGDGTTQDAAFSETSLEAPQGPYAESKWQAEQGLRELGSNSGIPICIVRPPLVYGPGVRANFLSLMRWVHRGLPLPFGALNNSRSLIYVENLANLLATFACEPTKSAGCHTYLVSDGQDLSTPELVQHIAHALGVAPRLLDVPESVLRRAMSLLGRQELAERLCGSLQVDPALVRAEFGWVPPFSVDEGLARTATWFKREA